jgi:hypothetical protein
MMERAADTNQKRRQTIIDNEEAVHEYRREVHRQRDIATTPTQSNHGTKGIYIRVKYKGAPDLLVSIDNSSTTAGDFAANPHRPAFNPYTQRPLYKNTRYLKHK